MFEYQLKLSKRRKTVALKVTDTGVHVYAPYGACITEVERWLSTKKSWVEAQQTRLAIGVQIQIPWQSNKVMIFGEAFEFLFGTCNYIDHQKKQVVIKTSTRSSVKSIRAQLIKLLAVELEQYVDSKLHHFSTQMNAPVATVKFREYKSRWGSCSSQYALTFNVLLAGAPKRMIDYVMVHELAHCHVLSHNKAFWQLVGKYDRDYKQAVKWFRENAKQLFIAKE
ncbi:YgjP-like metallopeptidase domain-containing protein [Pseudoalteromonas sp. MMG022]|uniref:M48 family metallopeptidase n=1 Tax=Pseudoalteromonas sp. MMG022 TaxID=2909978 RepID=UPI001F2E1C1B|nr:YgjP-like metallopeptidase domain-containing protein [Pseudoalteromonas sp. MMG022]MCF6435758.1 M48 family metallopeptidase [Pseudoalteromonas sp. MMG022]